MVEDFLEQAILIQPKFRSPLRPSANAGFETELVCHFKKDGIPVSSDLKLYLGTGASCRGVWDG